MRKKQGIRGIAQMVYERGEEMSSSPVRRIKPPNTSEPADTCTVATILLRRNQDHYRSTDSCPNKSYLYKMFMNSQERQLTEAESKKVLAVLAVVRGRK